VSGKGFYRIAYFSTATLLVAGSAASAPTAGQLFTDCAAKPTSWDAGFCNGYNAGIADSLMFSKVICLPDKTTYGDIYGLIRGYFVKHRREGGGLLAQRAVTLLQAKYPCAKAKTTE
jgi:hypothetical protein